jgi:FKBP-type peptidyl-prolyl cis-trans isomerase
MRLMLLVMLVLSVPLRPMCLMETHLKSVPRAQLVEAVGSFVWDGLTDRSPSFVSGLKAGMQEVERLPPSGEELELLEDVAYLIGEAEYYRHATVNYAASQALFDRLADDDTLTTIIAEGVVYKTLREGSGGPVPSDFDVVVLKYRIAAWEGTAEHAAVYADTNVFPEPVPHGAAELLPALNLAIVGMRPGEVREVYLHPDYAYGCSSAFEPGVSLIAKIELVSHPSGSAVHPRVQRHLGPSRTVTQSDLDSVYFEAGRIEGIQCWSHFRKASRWVSLEEVLATIDLLGEGGQLSITEDQALDLFTKLQCYLLDVS